jgi:hypothetical protein
MLGNQNLVDAGTGDRFAAKFDTDGCRHRFASVSAAEFC